VLAASFFFPAYAAAEPNLGFEKSFRHMSCQKYQLIEDNFGLIGIHDVDSYC